MSDIIHIRKFIMILLIIISVGIIDGSAQAPTPPIPIEVFAGNNDLYFLSVFKRQFNESNFSLFSLATYTTEYETNSDENSVVVINQLSYTFDKGFGLMGGIEMNSVVGYAPIIGPQHNFANQKWLTVTILSFAVNDGQDARIFGLYEYKPAISEKLGMYNRLQFLYNQSLEEESHNRSYLYLRSGLKKNNFIFGLAANLDRYRPDKETSSNYGIFVRYEFR